MWSTWYVVTSGCMTCLVNWSEMAQQANEAAMAGQLAAASWAVESRRGERRGGAGGEHGWAIMIAGRVQRLHGWRWC